MLKVCLKSTVGTVPHDARAFVFVSRHLSEVITATVHGKARLMIRQLLQSPWLHHGELQNFEPPLPTIFGRYLPESRAEQLLCSSTCTWLLEKCCFAGRENREKTRSLSQEVPTFIHSNKTQKVAPVRATHSQPSYRFQPLFYFFHHCEHQKVGSGFQSASLPPFPSFSYPMAKLLRPPRTTRPQLR